MGLILAMIYKKNITYCSLPSIFRVTQFIYIVLLKKVLHIALIYRQINKTYIF